MSNYSPIVSYAPKDALLTGDPAKKIKGTELGAEFDAISTMSSSKEDAANKGASNGYAGLNASAKLNDSVLSSNVPLLDSSSNTFTGQIRIESTSPLVRFTETDAGSDEKVWRAVIAGDSFSLQTRTDVDGTGETAIQVGRTGTNVDTVTLSGDSISLSASSISLSGPATLANGSEASPAINFSSDQNSGLYSIANGSVGMSIDGTIAAKFNSSSVSCTTFNLGGPNETDTTLSRSSAGEVAVEGKVLWNDTSLVVASGTYTPTITNGGNVAASTGNVCQYVRVQNMVTVSGSVDIDPTTASTSTDFEMSLPIASNFTNQTQLGGTGADTSGSTPYRFFGSAANDRAVVNCGTIVGTPNRTVSFVFMYRVL